MCQGFFFLLLPWYRKGYQKSFFYTSVVLKFKIPVSWQPWCFKRQTWVYHMNFIFKMSTIQQNITNAKIWPHTLNDWHKQSMSPSIRSFSCSQCHPNILSKPIYWSIYNHLIERKSSHQSASFVPTWPVLPVGDYERLVDPLNPSG